MKRSRAATMIYYLPNDVVIDILLRLPAKSLGLCKCVSRRFYNLIQNPNFINNFLHHPQNPTRFFAFSGNYISSIDYVLSLFNEDYLSVRQEIHNPVPNRHKWIHSIAGSINGRYLIARTYDNVVLLALWNSSTSEFTKLPSPFSSSFQPPTDPNSVKQGSFFGFGSADGDVRVVFIQQIFRVYGVSYKRELVVSLYSLARDCWEDIDDIPYRFKHCITITNEDSMATNFKGVCYWIARPFDRGEQFLLLFDMISGDFREVNLPPLCANKNAKKSICVRNDSSIVLFDQRFVDSTHSIVLESIHLWEMKEEGVWLRLLLFQPSPTYARNWNPIPHLFWRKDEIIVHIYKLRKVLSYNIVSDEIRFLDIDRVRILHTFLSELRREPHFSKSTECAIQING